MRARRNNAKEERGGRSDPAAAPFEDFCLPMPDELRTEPPRPSPDALLEQVRGGMRGRLKIFLGAAPGVGKTYEMLLAGRARRAEGVDVVVGVVETHGRKETEGLVAGLEVLPPVTVAYKGRTLQEMDL